MRIAIGFLFAVLLVLPGVGIAQQGKKPNILDEMKRREKEIKKSEARKAWKNIQWRKSAEAAVADATKDGSPLLIVLLVGELGRPKADRC